MQEIWKTIDGYDGRYQVSNYGNVRSVYSGSRFKVRKPQVHEIKKHDNSAGYIRVQLYKNGIPKKFLVHRLVAEAFCENPNEYKYVNHKDFDRKNNNADNLEWCTCSQNVLHSVKNRKPYKEKCKRSNTNEKYICYSDGRYFVSFQTKSFTLKKSFKTFEEAKVYRERALEEWEKRYERK